VAAEHDAHVLRVRAAQGAELEPEVETRPLPGEPADPAGPDLARQPLAVARRGDRDHRVGVHVIDVRVRYEGVQRRVDARRARIQREGAVREERHHLVLVLAPAVAPLEGQELLLDERREPVEPHRPEVAARALDPQDLDRFARERIRATDLGRGVAAGEVRDRLVRAEQVRAVEQPVRLVEGRGVGLVPARGERCGVAHGGRHATRAAAPAPRGALRA
jgi:hypothetical protein